MKITEFNEPPETPLRRPPGDAEAYDSEAAEPEIAAEKPTALLRRHLREAQLDIPLGYTTRGRLKPGKDRSQRDAQDPEYAARQPAYDPYECKHWPHIPETGTEKCSKGNVGHIS